MSEQRDLALDRFVAKGLKIGAYAGFAILVAEMVLSVFVPQRITSLLSHVGVLVIMATPAFRIVIALVVYLRERDYKYAAISVGVLLILIIGSIFGIG